MGSCSFKTKRIAPKKAEISEGVKLELTTKIILNNELKSRRLLYRIKEMNAPVLCIASSDLYLRRKVLNNSQVTQVD